MQSIVKAVRMRVSADKNRYLDGNFDLDLTYISDRIIAMSFPADGVESTYRNSIHEVSAMLNCRHFGHFMVFNLSERMYDYSILNDMVLDWCGFPDHHAPPLALLCKIVRTLHAWLEADASNVVVVHCLAGKGRTGTVIASYLIFAGLFNSAQDAMNYFALRRSLNSWGITGPSQKRYIQYFSDVIQKRAVPRSNPVTLKMIIMHTIPEFAITPMRPGICPVLQIFSIAPEGGPGRMLYSSQEGHEGEDLRSFPTSDRSLAFHVNRVVRGDILVVFLHVNAFYRMEQMLRFNIHTGMFTMPRLRLTKTELDGAEGDKRFDYSFFLDLVFEDLEGDIGPANHAMWDAAIDMEQQLMIWKQDLCSGAICFTPEATQSTAEKIQKARALASNRGFVIGKSGWLTKKGHQVKNWKRRWFVLKDATLSYYKSPKQTTPAGIIPVTDILRVWSDPEISKREEMPLCFELITCKPGNTGKIVTYVISAPNDADREDWIQCIETSMSSTYEVGRLFVDIIEVSFKYADGSTLASETIYCTIIFGRQRFQSMSVPSIPGRWDQTAQFVVFEEPNEIVVSLYLQSDDSLLGSTTIDSVKLQQRALEAAETDNETAADLHLSLISTNSALQRFQIRNIDLLIASKFRSSSDLVSELSDDPADMYNAGIDGDFLVLPEASPQKDKPARVRSASLGTMVQQANANQKTSERSATMLEPHTSTNFTNSTNPTNPTPLSTSTPTQSSVKPEDANWIKPGAGRGNTKVNGLHQSAENLNATGAGNRFQIGARPGSTQTPSAGSDSPLSTWFGKMATNLISQFDNAARPYPAPSTLQPSNNRTPNRSPTHSPNHSPRLSSHPPNPLPNQNPDSPNTNTDVRLPPPRPQSPPPRLSSQFFQPPPNYSTLAPPSRPAPPPPLPENSPAPPQQDATKNNPSPNSQTSNNQTTNTQITNHQATNDHIPNETTNIQTTNFPKSITADPVNISENIEQNTSTDTITHESEQNSEITIKVPEPNQESAKNSNNSTPSLSPREEPSQESARNSKISESAKNSESAKSSNSSTPLSTPRKGTLGNSIIIEDYFGDDPSLYENLPTIEENEEKGEESEEKDKEEEREEVEGNEKGDIEKGEREQEREREGSETEESSDEDAYQSAESDKEDKEKEAGDSHEETKEEVNARKEEEIPNVEEKREKPKEIEGRTERRDEREVQRESTSEIVSSFEVVAKSSNV